MKKLCRWLIKNLFSHCLPAFHDLNTFISNEIYSLYKEKFPSIKNGLEVMIVFLIQFKVKFLIKQKTDFTQLKQ